MSPLRDIYGSSIPLPSGLSRKITVVMPAFNESATVASVIDAVRETLDGWGKIDFIVVDDGSTDETMACAQAAGAFVVRHRWNEGLGVAIATGIDTALRLGADIIITMDSDGQFNNDDVLEVIRPIINDEAEMVVGSRYARADYIPAGTPYVKLMMAKMLAWVVGQVLWGKIFSDVTCGFRAYTRNAAIRINFFSRFTYTVESIVDAVQKGISLRQVPVRASAVREHGKSRLTSNFPRYTFGIFLILTRRMRDSRPLIFYGVHLLLFLSFGLVTLLTMARLWPFEESKQIALLITGVSIINLSIIANVALLADQLLASTRVLNSIVRMQRVQIYNNASILDPPSLRVDVAEVPLINGSDYHGNGKVDYHERESTFSDHKD